MGDAPQPLGQQRHRTAEIEAEEARAADHVILVSGRVIANGPPETVLTPENLATAYGLGRLHPENMDPSGPLDDAYETDHHHDLEG